MTSEETGGEAPRAPDSPEEPSRLSRAGKGIVAAGRGAGRVGAGVVKGFWSGFSYPLKGARFVFLDHPGLVRIWIWPIAATLAVFFLLGLAVFMWHDDLLALVWSEPTGDGAWARVQMVLRPVAQVILFAVLALIALFLVIPISSILSGPFNGMLAEEVERIHKGLEPVPWSFQSFLDDLWLTARLEATKLLIYAPLMAGLFLLSLLLPIVGQMIYVVFGALFAITYNAVDYTDWPLARRGKGVVERMLVLRRRFLPLMGLGAAVWLILFVPLLCLLVIPAGVAGGTLLILDMEEEGLLDPQTVPTAGASTTPEAGG